MISIGELQAIFRLKDESAADVQAIKGHLADVQASASKMGGELKNAFENPMGAIQSLSGSIGESGMLGIAFAAAAGGALIVFERLKDLAEEAAAVGGAIQDMSEKTGIAVEPLSQLKFAVEVAGGSLDQLSNAVFMFQRNLGEGSDKFAKGLDRIGLAVADLQALSPDQQFLKVAQSIKEIEDPSQRAAAAMELFGRQGRDLLPLLNKPLADLVEQSKALGFTWSTEDAEAAERLEMQSKKLHLQWEQLWTDLGRVLIPSLTRLFDVLSAIVAPMNALSGTTAQDLSNAWVKNAEETKKFQAALQGTAATAKTADALMSGMTFNIHTQASELTAAAKAQKDTAETTKNDLLPVISQAETSYQDLAFKVDNYRAVGQEATDAAREYLHNHRDDIQEAVDAMDNLNATTLDFGVVTIPDLVSHLDHSATAFQEWFGVLDTGLGRLPALIEKGLTGGGGLSGALKGFGSVLGGGLFAAGGPLNQLGNSLTMGATKLFGSSIGNALGTALPGIGAAIGAVAGPLLDKLFHLGGPSAQELKGRDVEAQFEQAQGGLKGMQQALMGAGLSADEANARITAMWNAEKQGGAAVQAQIDGMNGLIKQHAADVSTGVNDILAAAKTLGGEFPAALEPMVQKLLSLPGLTDAEKNSLLGVLNDGKPSLSELTQEAAKYGMGLDALGAKTQQLSISTQADQILKEFKDITGAGADYGNTVNHFSGAVNDLVQNALKYGSSLPTALQPIAQALIDSGQLVDVNGTKIKDLSKLKFNDTDDPLAKGMSSLTKAIEHLAELFGDMPKNAKDAADGIGLELAKVKPPTIPLHFAYDTSGGDDGRNNRAATGGLVTAYGIQHFAAGGFVPSGTDTVPAMLTPGEMVLTRQQQAAWLGGGGLQVTVNVPGYIHSSAKAELAQMVSDQISRDARLKKYFRAG
jgi:hypothetical protein